MKDYLVPVLIDDVGMIELPPPRKLRERVAKSCLEQDDIHQYRNRFIKHTEL